MKKISEIRKEARKSLSGKWGNAILLLVLYVMLYMTLYAIGYVLKNINILSFLFSLICIIIDVPISFGVIVSFIKLKRGEKVEPFEFLKIACEYFSMAWAVFFSQLAKVLLPILFISMGFLGACIGYNLFSTYQVLGAQVETGLGIALMAVGLIWFIMIYIDYVFAINIAFDEPKLTANEAVEKSLKIIKGNRLKYCGLILSFIGIPLVIFAILGVLACIYTKCCISIVIFAYIMLIAAIWLIPYMEIADVCFYDELKKNNK